LFTKHEQAKCADFVTTESDVNVAAAAADDDDDNDTMCYYYRTASLDDNDLVLVVQTLIHKCMENEHLCNEAFLQLIKQTTDTKTGEIRRLDLLTSKLLTFTVNV